MTNFTATGNWTSQGNVVGVVTFAPSTGASVTTGTITNGTLSVSVPVISGNYLVTFTGVTVNGVPGTIAPFDFVSPSSSVTVSLNAIAGPSPTVVSTGGNPASLFVPSYVGWAGSAETSLTNTTTPGTLVALTVGSGQLQAGSAFRITARGSVQVATTSGTLTFTPQLGANAAAQTFQMASQGSAAGPVAFFLQTDVVVRSAGASGAYISHGYGRIEFTTPSVLSTTSTTTAAVDTTQPTTTIQLNAAWATASASNILLVETAVIERLA